MPDPVRVAIRDALLTRAAAFATANSLTISMPNVPFTPPAEGKTAKWLRASLLPAPSFSLGISYGEFAQHYGILQVDVFYGQGAGELAPARVSSAVISYFKRGTVMNSGGFTIEIIKEPTEGPAIKSDPWLMVPVSIPYVSFAKPA